MKTYTSLILALLLIYSCDIKQKDYKAANDFIKIFNDSDTEKDYYPTGIAQTEDNGYLIVTGVKNQSSINEYPTTEYFKTNELGEIEWVKTSEYLAPASGTFAHMEEAGFIAMDGKNNAILFKINLENGDIIDQVDLDMKMPLACYNNNNDLAILGYNYIDLQTKLKTFSLSDFNNTTTSTFSIGQYASKDVQPHMNKTGDQFPFLIGEWIDEGNPSFFSICLSNESLRVVFLDGLTNKSKGDIFSQGTKASISSFLHKDDNKFAYTRYYKGDCYITLDSAINTSVSQQFNATGTILPELTYNAKVYSNKLITDRDTSMVFISTTNRNSVIVYQYKMNEEEPVNKFEIGFDEKIEICTATETVDMGYAVLVRIYVSGQYPRPMIIKLPPEKFKIE